MQQVIILKMALILWLLVIKISNGVIIEWIYAKGLLSNDPITVILPYAFKNYYTGASSITDNYEADTQTSFMKVSLTSLQFTCKTAYGHYFFDHNIGIILIGY